MFSQCLVNDEELVFSVLGVVFVLMSVSHGLLAGLEGFPVLCFCVGCDPRAFGDRWVRGSL